MTFQGPCWPSPENKPINGFQGPLPLAEVQEAEPPGGVSGRSPAPSTGSSDCHDPAATTGLPGEPVYTGVWPVTQFRTFHRQL